MGYFLVLPGYNGILACVVHMHNVENYTAQSCYSAKKSNYGNIGHRIGGKKDKQ
jgi:hypothetical protein